MQQITMMKILAIFSMIKPLKNLRKYNEISPLSVFITMKCANLIKNFLIELLCKKPILLRIYISPKIDSTY